MFKAKQIPSSLFGFYFLYVERQSFFVLIKMWRNRGKQRGTIIFMHTFVFLLGISHIRYSHFRKCTLQIFSRDLSTRPSADILQCVASGFFS